MHGELGPFLSYQVGGKQEFSKPGGETLWNVAGAEG